LLLRKEGYVFHRTSEFEIVREIKEHACCVSSSSNVSHSTTVTASGKEDKDVSRNFGLFLKSILAKSVCDA
jgi:hypothetical protein